MKCLQNGRQANVCTLQMYSLHMYAPLTAEDLQINFMWILAAAYDNRYPCPHRPGIHLASLILTRCRRTGRVFVVHGP